nr:V-type ATP synthase subunit B [Synergistales bacterium]
MRLVREGYRTVSSLRGPLLFADGLQEAGYGEIVTIETDNGIRKGQILQADEGLVSIQVFEGTAGIDPGNTTVWLERDEVKVPVGEGMVGKVLNGRGIPILGEEIGYIEDFLPVTGFPINPSSRKTPSSYIETGISSVDLMNTLVKGQKLPIFSGSGLPANELAAQIVQQARVPSKDTSFMVVF